MLRCARSARSRALPGAVQIRPPRAQAAALAALPKRPLRTAYVVNAAGELVASLDPRTLAAELRRGDRRPHQRIGEVATPVTVTLTPDLSLAAALDVFLRARARTLPAIAGPWRATFLGEVSRHDLLLVMHEQLSEAR